MILIGLKIILPEIFEAGEHLALNLISLLDKTIIVAGDSVQVFASVQ